jgi:predicted nucleotidyltransferase
MSLDGLFQELNDLYASGDGVLGTYISGSASYGGMTAYSDVDFYVLTKSHHAMFERILGSTKVEVRWRTRAEIELDIAQGGPFVYQMMDATAKADPQGVVAELIEEAKDRFDGYRPSKEVYKSLQFRLGEAKNKLSAALESEDMNRMGYLSGVYSPLLMEAIFILAGKPAAPATVAWRWLDRLPGLNPQGVSQIRNLFALTEPEKAAAMARQFDQFYGVVSRKVGSQ